MWLAFHPRRGACVLRIGADAVVLPSSAARYPHVRGSRRFDIKQGTRVRIKPTDALNRRPHLAQHARQGDVGVIGGPSHQSPQMARLYVIVRFDICGHDHRLLRDEISEA
jgi:hypothetical protein